MTSSLTDEVKAFIIDNFLFGDQSYPLDNGQSLIDSDLVDSTGILEIVAFVEERFGISVADAEMVPDNLDSIARIAGYVAAKQHG